MNLILFHEKLAEYHIPSGSAVGEHIRKVLRMGVGDKVFIGVCNGQRALAEVTRMSDIDIVLTPAWEPQTFPPQPIRVICGLPRPQTARRVLFEAACQRVQELVFFESIKGEPSYRSSKLWSTDEWQRHLQQGTEQGFHTWTPQVSHSKSLKSCDFGSTKLIALDIYEASCTLSEALREPWEEVTILLGSERGWSAEERNILRDNGAIIAHMGDNILKVETALTASLSIAAASKGLM